jgi:hypothetical protein
VIVGIPFSLGRPFTFLMGVCRIIQHIDPTRFARFVPVVVIAAALLINLQAAILIYRPTIANATTTNVPDFNIAAVGDWGCTTNTTATVNNILSKNAEIIIGLGDNSYAATADCWFQQIAQIDDQMYSAIGNHETENTTLLAQYMNHFNMQEQYFSFDYQNVHFLVLSTEMPYEIGSAQYNFAHNDLRSAASNPAIEWIIVSYHRNAYISPNETTAPSVSFRDIYHPIFQQYSVDLVLQGHMHSYERSFPLKFNGLDSNNPIIDNSSTNYYNDPDGQIFATVGTGGYSFHLLTSKHLAFANQSNNVYGFLNIDLSNQGKTLTATFFGNDGTTRDQFRIHKGVSLSSASSQEKCVDVNDVNSTYDYAPCLTLNGTDYYEIPSRTDLQLDTFSVAAWFRTNENHTSESFIVNKGGKGTDRPGENMNYGIWITSSQKIRAGFEDSSGEDYYATSPATYNDGKWHYAVVTYDGSSTVRLYIDGNLVASESTSGALPEKTGIQPLRIGANSRELEGFFTGNIDEIRVWNRELPASEIAAQYNNGAYNSTRQ